MALAKRSPCSACNPVWNVSELLKILERGDIGVTIYRYVGPVHEVDEMGRSEKRPKETLIFYTTKKANVRPGGMGMNIYAPAPKCMNYCPRCIELKRRIEAQFKMPSSDREADMRNIFSCPPCTDIVHKFRKFTAEDDILKEQDSELIHLQRLTSPDLDDAFDRARTKFDSLLKFEGADNEVKKKERLKSTNIPQLFDKDAAGSKYEAWKLKDKERAKDKKLKTQPSEVQKSSGQSGKDKKIKNADKTLHSKSEMSRSKVGNVDSKLEKLGRKSGKSDMTTKNISKEQSNKPSSFDKLSCRSTERNPLIRAKIAEFMHAQKCRKDIDSKLQDAEKKEEQARRARAQAEEARQLKFKAAMTQVPEPESEEGQTDECSDETVIKWRIKGVKICKAGKEDIAAHPSITTRSVEFPQPHPPPTPNTEVNTLPASTSKAHKVQDGRLTYHLSERKYVDNGWTLLPKEMVMRKITLFQMHPARNEFDWLEMNRHKERVHYDTGELLATFDENGCARIYYRSGVLALDFYQAEEKNAGGYRVVVYSTGIPAELGRAPPRTVLAAFDYSGNGAVFDHTGQPRLKYTQNDGAVLDRSIGPYTHWKWHNLNDSGRLQTVLIENEPLHKDPIIMKLEDDQSAHEKKSNDKSSGRTAARVEEKSVDKEIESDAKSYNEMVMKGIESKNVLKENSRRLKGFSPFQIKMKAFKINEHFSLRIVSQSAVFLTFTDGKTRLRINVGLVMDPTIILGQDLVEVGEVGSSLEKVPASESLVELQRVVRGARAAERARVLRERKLNPPLSHDPPSGVKDIGHKS